MQIARLAYNSIVWNKFVFKKWQLLKESDFVY